MWNIFVLALILFSNSFLVARVKKEVSRPLAVKSYLISSEQDIDLQKKSRGSLKETLGEELREVVHATLRVLDAVGDVHIEMGNKGVVQQKVNLDLGKTCKSMASMQKMVSDLLERLIDNDAPLKRATKITLRKSITLVRAISQQLHAEMRMLKGVIHLVKKEASKKDLQADSLLKQPVTMLTEHSGTMNSLCKKLENNALIKQL